jgi:hypothetical protein
MQMVKSCSLTWQLQSSKGSDRIDLSDTTRHPLFKETFSFPFFLHTYIFLLWLFSVEEVKGNIHVWLCLSRLGSKITTHICEEVLYMVKRVHFKFLVKDWPHNAWFIPLVWWSWLLVWPSEHRAYGMVGFDIAAGLVKVQEPGCINNCLPFACSTLSSCFLVFVSPSISETNFSFC